MPPKARKSKSRKGTRKPKTKSKAKRKSKSKRKTKPKSKSKPKAKKPKRKSKRKSKSKAKKANPKPKAKPKKKPPTRSYKPTQVGGKSNYAIQPKKPADTVPEGTVLRGKDGFLWMVQNGVWSKPKGMKQGDLRKIQQEQIEKSKAPKAPKKKIIKVSKRTIEDEMPEVKSIIKTNKNKSIRNMPVEKLIHLAAKESGSKSKTIQRDNNTFQEEKVYDLGKLKCSKSKSKKPEKEPLYPFLDFRFEL